MHNPLIIANEFIRLSSKDRNYLDSMQLIKLSYIAHGIYLAKEDTPLSIEPARAWLYGPVFLSLSHLVKLHNSWFYKFKKPIKLKSETILSQREKDIIQETYKLYGKKNAWELSQLTHEKETPWHDIFTRIGNYVSHCTEIIKDEKIKEHYKKLISQTQVS